MNYLLREIHPLLSLLVILGTVILIAAIGIFGMHFFYKRKHCGLLFWLCYLMTFVVPDIAHLIGNKPSIAEGIIKSLEDAE